VSVARDRLLRELDRQADLRHAAQASAQEAMAEIARLLPAAIEAGISKREISRRTGVSRTWIDELLGQRDQSESG
jgi:hypothetical protein